MKNIIIFLLILGIFILIYLNNIEYFRSKRKQRRKARRKRIKKRRSDRRSRRKRRRQDNCKGKVGRALTKCRERRTNRRNRESGETIYGENQICNPIDEYKAKIKTEKETDNDEDEEINDYDDVSIDESTETETETETDSLFNKNLLSNITENQLRYFMKITGADRLASLNWLSKNTK